MFEPVRGGTRGGQAEFTWSDVSKDKDREHYLGHSINAPTGRWQKNKDVHWYSRREEQKEDGEREEEIRKIKELEANALSAALGFESTSRNVVQSSGAGSDHEKDKEKMEKEERKRKKAERKEQRRAKKEVRNAMRDRYESGGEDSGRRRSRSPHRRDTHERDRDYHSRRSQRRRSSPSSGVKKL